MKSDWPSQAEPVARDAEPFDLEPVRQARRSPLELAQRLAVFAFAGALPRPRPRQFAEMVEGLGKARLRRRESSAESRAGVARVWKTTQ